MRRTTGQSYVLPALQAAVGLVWLRAGLAQIDSGQLMAGIGGMPALFDAARVAWYLDLMTGLTVSSHGLLGDLTMYCELLVGAGLIGTAVLALMWRDGGEGGVPVLPSVAALLGGTLMSWNCWMASGMASQPASYALGVLQVAMLVALIVGRIPARPAPAEIFAWRRYQAAV